MIQARLPSGRVVTVNTDDPKVAAATVRGFVLKDPYETARSQGAAHPVAAAVETAARAVPGLSEIQAGMNSAGSLGLDLLTGKQHLDPKDPAGSLDAARRAAWSRTRSSQQGLVDSLQAQHPIASALTTGTAMAAPVAAAILTGGATEAPQLAEAAKGVSGFLKSTAPRIGRGAMTGGAAGAVYGASQPGTAAQRLKSASIGALVGELTGGALPVAGDAVAATGNAGKAVGRTVIRAANKATGGAMLDATQTAANRLTAALKADGATADVIRAAMNGFLKNGATDPALIDVASRLPSGGQNTLALVRAASAKGSGRNVAATYAGQVASDLQDKAIARTRALTPDTRPAPVVQAAATKARDEAATTEYRGPYGQPVDAVPVIPAIEGDAGRVGISAAFKDADALRLKDEMAELAKLRSAANPEPAPTPVASIGGDVISSPSLDAKIRAQLGLDAAPTDEAIPVRLGTLDRIKIALNDAGRDAADKGQNARAAGFFQRAAEVDDHLADQSSDYRTARDNYAKASAGIDAVDHGATALTASPDDYVPALGELRARGGDAAGANAGIGYRQAITDALGAPTEGATGALNRVSTSTNQGRNLEATFGPEMADSYRAGLKDLANQLQNARFINPNTGSQTAGRLEDLGLIEPQDVHLPKVSPMGLVLGAINKIRAGATLTDAERAEIARIGTTRAEPNMIDLTPDLTVLPSQMLDSIKAHIAGAVPADQNQDRTSQ